MKKTNIVKLLKKNFTQVLLVIIAILLLANLVTKQNLLAGLTIFSPLPTPTPTVSSITPSPISTPTAIPTPTPVYIYIQPTTTPIPTLNPDIQNRINQIDEQIKKLQEQWQSHYDLARELADSRCGTDGCQTIFLYHMSMQNNIKSQINQLQNEKTDLKLLLK